MFDAVFVVSFPGMVVETSLFQTSPDAALALEHYVVLWSDDSFPVRYTAEIKGSLNQCTVYPNTATYSFYRCFNGNIKLSSALLQQEKALTLGNNKEAM